MMTFEEWCSDREININELSPKFLTMAYKIWGEECYYETKKLETENAELRARLDKAVELPCKVGDSAYYIQNGKIYYGTVICLCANSKGVKTIGIDLPSLCIGENMPSSLCIEENEINKKLFFTIDEAKSRLAELKGEAK